jgi:hypothetical protein
MVRLGIRVLVRSKYFHFVLITFWILPSSFFDEASAFFANVAATRSGKTSVASANTFGYFLGGENLEANDD